MNRYKHPRPKGLLGHGFGRSKGKVMEHSQTKLRKVRRHRKARAALAKLFRRGRG